MVWKEKTGQKKIKRLELTELGLVTDMMGTKAGREKSNIISEPGS